MEGDGLGDRLFERLLVESLGDELVLEMLEVFKFGLDHGFILEYVIY